MQKARFDKNAYDKNTKSEKPLAFSFHCDTHTHTHVCMHTHLQKKKRCKEWKEEQCFRVITRLVIPVYLGEMFEKSSEGNEDNERWRYVKERVWHFLSSGSHGNNNNQHLRERTHYYTH